MARVRWGDDDGFFSIVVLTEVRMKRAEELVLEREPESNMGAANLPASTIKSILFYVRDDAGLDARLQSALSLARACSAHLHCLQITPLEAYTIVDTYGGTFVSDEIVTVLEEEAAKLRKRIEGQLFREDVSWTYEATTSQAIAQLLRGAALADLVIMGRLPRIPEFGGSGPKLIGEIVTHAGAPLCIPGDEAQLLDPFGTAIIAWNGSVEAAHAVRSTIGLLKLASNVRVIRYAEEKIATFPDTRLLEYLSLHSIPAELETRARPRELGTALIEYASRARASYLVMGPYSHTRAGEFLFGGVTRSLLRECPITLVMAH